MAATMLYTRTGDKGTTGLLDGTRVKKNSLRVESYGTVDELNSVLGLAKHYVDSKSMFEKIEIIQKELFWVAAELAVVQKKVCKPPLSGKIKLDDGGLKL